MHWEMLLSLLKKRVSDRIRKRIRAIEQELLFIVQKKRKTVTRIFTGPVKDGSYYCLFVFLSIVLFIVWGCSSGRSRKGIPLYLLWNERERNLKRHETEAVPAFLSVS